MNHKAHTTKLANGLYRTYVCYHTWIHIVRTQPGDKWITVRTDRPYNSLTELAAEFEGQSFGYHMSLGMAQAYAENTYPADRCMPMPLTFNTAVMTDGKRLAFKFGYSDIAPHYYVMAFDAQPAIEGRIDSGPADIKVMADTHESALAEILATLNATMTDESPLDIRMKIQNDAKRALNRAKYADVIAGLESTLLLWAINSVERDSIESAIELILDR